jgi:hypothetical protein
MRKRRPEFAPQDLGESFAPVLERADIACRERNAVVKSGSSVL